MIAKIKWLYEKMLDETKEYIPVAINVVEGIIKVMDSPVDDILLGIIVAAMPNKLTGAKLFILKDKIEQALPKILIELNMVEAIANIEDTNDQLKAVLEALKVSTEDTKAEKYNIIATKLLVILSDNKISWSEAIVFTE